MTKKRKRKHPHYVKPDFSVGQMVMKYGTLYTIESVCKLNTGNRPSYTLEGLQGIFSEVALKEVEESND